MMATFKLLPGFLLLLPFMVSGLEFETIEVDTNEQGIQCLVKKLDKGQTGRLFPNNIGSMTPEDVLAECQEGVNFGVTEDMDKVFVTGDCSGTFKICTHKKVFGTGVQVVLDDETLRIPKKTKNRVEEMEIVEELSGTCIKGKTIKQNENKMRLIASGGCTALVSVHSKFEKLCFIKKLYKGQSGRVFPNNIGSMKPKDVSAECQEGVNFGVTPDKDKVFVTGDCSGKFKICTHKKVFETDVEVVVENDYLQLPDGTRDAKKIDDFDLVEDLSSKCVEGETFKKWDNGKGVRASHGCAGIFLLKARFDWPSPCPDTNRICPGKDVFNGCDEQCACRTHGAPGLHCANDETEHFASETSDPQVRTVDGREMTEMPLPCMYLFSHIAKTDCEIKFYLYNIRHKRKDYVGGFVAVVDLKEEQCIFEAHAHAEYGVYTYLFHGDESCLRRGDYFTVSRDDNKIELQLTQTCGAKASFRPADTTKSIHEQLFMPGFAYSCTPDVEFPQETLKEVIALPPGELESSSAGAWGVTIEDANMVRGLIGSGSEVDSKDRPNYTPKCKEVGDVLNECIQRESLRDALRVCGFIVENDRFMNCDSDNESEVEPQLKLFGTCMKAHCTNDYNLCKSYVGTLQNLINNGKCTIRDIPPINLDETCNHMLQR